MLSYGTRWKVLRCSTQIPRISNTPFARSAPRLWPARSDRQPGTDDGREEAGGVDPAAGQGGLMHCKRYSITSLAQDPGRRSSVRGVEQDDIKGSVVGNGQGLHDSMNLGPFYGFPSSASFHAVSIRSRVGHVECCLTCGSARAPWLGHKA